METLKGGADVVKPLGPWRPFKAVSLVSSSWEEMSLLQKAEIFTSDRFGRPSVYRVLRFLSSCILLIFCQTTFTSLIPNLFAVIVDIDIIMTATSASTVVFPELLEKLKTAPTAPGEYHSLRRTAGRDFSVIFMIIELASLCNLWFRGCIAVCLWICI